MEEFEFNKENIVKELKTSLSDLESRDASKIENAALKIAALLIGWEHEESAILPEFEEIRDLALDLEIPQELVEDYESKVSKIIELISKLNA